MSMALSVWVPYTSLDQLLVALQEQNHPTYVKMYSCLRDKVDKYQNRILEASNQIAVS